MCGHIFISLGYIFRTGISESYGNHLLNPLRNCQTVFQSGCVILYSHQQCINVLLSSYPHHHLSLSVLWLQSFQWIRSPSPCGFDLHFHDVQYLFYSFIAASLDFCIILHFLGFSSILLCTSQSLLLSVPLLPAC